MKKYIFSLLAIALVLLFAGCSKDGGKAEPEIKDVADALISSEVFSEPLGEIDSSVGISVYELDSADVTDSVFYMSTGATAEELSVFKAKDKDAAARIKDAIETRVKRQSDSFASYGPAEVPKLDKADIRVSGSTVAFCVCSSADDAAKILDKYF